MRKKKVSEAKNPVNKADQPANDELLSNIKADYDKDKAGKRSEDAVRDLISLLDLERYVGDLISMDYGTAESQDSLSNSALF